MAMRLVLSFEAVDQQCLNPAGSTGKRPLSISASGWMIWLGWSGLEGSRRHPTISVLELLGGTAWRWTQFSAARQRRLRQQIRQPPWPLLSGKSIRPAASCVDRKRLAEGRQSKVPLRSLRITFAVTTLLRHLTVLTLSTGESRRRIYDSIRGSSCLRGTRPAPLCRSVLFQPLRPGFVPPGQPCVSFGLHHTLRWRTRVAIPLGPFALRI